ncbi:MAG TPA: efflux RND transporter periplasmic adaptor subunit, partial [Pyrinomonadaceae bacterium]
LALCVLAACACCWQAGCGANSQVNAQRQPAAAQGPTAPAGPQPVSVNVVEAQGASAPAELLVPAALAVENTALVLAQRDGTLVAVSAEEGQSVHPGQTLARLDDEEQRAQLRQAELEVGRLQIEEQQYKALINVNRNELNRELQLAKAGLSSQAEVERAQYRLDAATSEYEKTRLATQTAQARVEAVKLELTKSQIAAPRGGVVTRRYVSQGTGVVRGDKLFELAQLTPLVIKFQVPQAGAARLAVGQVVRLSVGETGADAQARVRRIDPVADPTSSTIGYLADVTGGASLRPGLTFNVHVPRPAALSVWLPRAALPAGQDPRPNAPATIFILNGDHCELRDIWVNALAGDQLEITSGLTPGERVILAPPPDLKPGDPVTTNQD